MGPHVPRERSNARERERERDGNAKKRDANAKERWQCNRNRKITNCPLPFKIRLERRNVNSHSDNITYIMYDRSNWICQKRFAVISFVICTDDVLSSGRSAWILSIDVRKRLRRLAKNCFILKSALAMSAFRWICRRICRRIMCWFRSYRFGWIIHSAISVWRSLISIHQITDYSCGPS